MCEVEPDGHNPHEVDDCEDRVAECLLDPSESVCWRDCAVVADYLSPHHVVLEVPEVEQHAEHYDDAEHEHVLACPLDSSWLVGDFVLVVASCLSVLGSKDEGIDDVNCHEGSEAACCDDGIPVGAEQFANLVVGFLAEEGYNVHAPMEGQEHNLYTLLKEESTLYECIVKSKYYDIIAGSLLLAYADTEFNQLGREYLLKERIEKANYDALEFIKKGNLDKNKVLKLELSRCMDLSDV